MGQFINSGRRAGSRPGSRRAGVGWLARQLRGQGSVERAPERVTRLQERRRRLSRGHDARRPDGEELLLARRRHPGQRARHPGQAPHGRRAAEVFEADHGEAPPRPHQREPRAAEDADPGRPQEGQLPALQAGEGGYPGDDGEALAQPAAGPDGGGAPHGPLRLVQVPSRLQRVPDGGDPLPLLLRGRQRGGPPPAARTPGRLPEPDRRPGLRARRPAARSPRRAAAGPGARRRGAPSRPRGFLQAGRCGRRERQSVRQLPAFAGFRRAVRLPRPPRGLWAPRRRHPPAPPGRGPELLPPRSRPLVRIGRPVAPRRLPLETLVSPGAPRTPPPADSARWPPPRLAACK